MTVDLGLTEEQRKEINGELAEARGALWDHVYRQPATDRHREASEIRRAVQVRLMEHLPDGDPRWQAMIGEPFHSDGPLIPKDDLFLDRPQSPPANSAGSTLT